MLAKGLNARMSAYKEALASGEIQEIYQNLIGIVQNLRTEFSKKYEGEFSVANVQHGYLDFTYFYLQNNYLKENKLKLAIVLNHRHANFELWLLGQTKDVQIRYWRKLKDVKWINENVMPEFAIFETMLLATPDFDDSTKLLRSINSQFEVLSQEILNTLEAHE